MKSSLFRAQPARKTRLTMMVAGAVLIHFGMVVAGAWWHWPVVEQKNDQTLVDVIGSGLEPVDETTQYLPVDNTAPSPSQESTTPTPEIPVQVDPLPPEVVPEMPEPYDAPPPKPRRMPSHTANPSAATNALRTVVGTSGTSVGDSGTTLGIQGVGRAGIQSWRMPKPPYPAAARASSFQGATTVRITTDANGNVAVVDVIRSAGNALMDHNTQTYVRAFWKGPPNATRTTEFVYQLH